ncbi:MAG: ribose-5-phosphate isomerase [Patescibacteria group bacterium]|nr:MAG: ribose-5-phosphate isomerase [Patescibacteria group bacterium]
MEKPIIIIGSDHGGFEQKQVLKAWLESERYQVEDVGAHTLDPTDDYPQVAFGVAQRVVENEAQVTQPGAVGIIICRSAGGVTIAANKVEGARAVCVFDERSAIHAKEHNNANIITLSGDWISSERAKEIVQVFLTAIYRKDTRHERRIAQIKKFEAEHS